MRKSSCQTKYALKKWQKYNSICYFEKSFVTCNKAKKCNALQQIAICLLYSCNKWKKYKYKVIAKFAFFI